MTMHVLYMFFALFFAQQPCAPGDRQAVAEVNKHVLDYQSSESEASGEACKISPPPEDIQKYQEDVFEGTPLGVTNPRAVFMAGGPGSGKSTIFPMLKLDNPPKFDLDDVLKKLFPNDDATKFYNCIPQAVPILDSLYDIALEKKTNFINDMTGRNFGIYHGLAQRFKEENYITELAGSYLPIAVAVRRVQSRQAIENRAIDIGYMTKVYEDIENNFEKYIRSTTFDRVCIYNNNVAQGADPKLMVCRESGDDVEVAVITFKEAVKSQAQ